MVRRTAMTLVALAGAAAGTVETVSAAPARKVELMIVGKERTLLEARTVPAPRTRVTSRGKRCGAPAATPLAALAAARRRGGPRFEFSQDGSCGALFVTRIGPDANRGLAGWVYKVDSRLGTTGADDPSGPFGTGRRLRAGARLTWFWCVLSASGTCQRSLELDAPRAAAPGSELTVTVRGVDDFGKARAASGVRVEAGSQTAVTDRRGRAVLTAPATAGTYAVTARRRGLIPSFPETIAVG